MLNDYCISFLSICYLWNEYIVALSLFIANLQLVAVTFARCCITIVLDVRHGSRVTPGTVRVFDAELG